MLLNPAKTMQPAKNTKAATVVENKATMIVISKPRHQLFHGSDNKNETKTVSPIAYRTDLRKFQSIPPGHSASPNPSSTIAPGHTNRMSHSSPGEMGTGERSRFAGENGIGRCS